MNSPFTPHETTEVNILCILYEYCSHFKDDHYLIEFKRDYHQHGKYDLAAQVPHLARLAEYYHGRYRVTNDWADCLKVSFQISFTKYFSIVLSYIRPT